MQSGGKNPSLPTQLPRTHRGKRDLGARLPGQPRCCHLPPHPFLSHLAACPRAHRPPCHPSQEAMALLHSPAAPCPDPAAFPAGSPYLLLRRPCPGAERLPRARARLQQRPGEKLEDENIRGRRDLKPRNCLAQFVLYKGGEYPRERSAHAFPRSWKSVTLCIGRVVFVGISPPPHFLFSIVHTVKSTPSQVWDCVSCGWRINLSLTHLTAL